MTMRTRPVGATSVARKLVVWTTPFDSARRVSRPCILSASDRILHLPPSDSHPDRMLDETRWANVETSPVRLECRKSSSAKQKDDIQGSFKSSSRPAFPSERFEL